METRIREVESSDASSILNIYAPFVSDSATSFETSVPDLEEMRRRIENLRHRYPWLVCETDRKLLGYAYASPHRTRRAYQWCVEVSVYIDQDVRHRGIGRALYIGLFELLRRQGFVNAYAGITLPNPASVRLHESIGFLPVGVFSRIGFKAGQWHDVAWFHLRLSEPAVPIPEPLPSRPVFQEEHIHATLEECARSIRLD